MIVNLKEINNYCNEIGAKALRLKELKDAGLSVPDFLVVPSGFFKKNVDVEGFIKSDIVNVLVADIIKKLKCDQYAVRSSALIEDSNKESLAGQFSTKVAVDEADLAQAINEVTAQAFKYLNGKMNDFSIIIQKFVEADYSGVTFTRSPLGGREMTIEIVKGRGGKLVGGESLPQKHNFYWNQTAPEDMCLTSEHISRFKDIERYYNFPQDIEWCVKDDVFFVLQTRPVTNISEIDYCQMLYLDNTLKKNKKYYFQKTEISEIVPRPKPITLSLLKKIYGAGGPIESVYSKFNIKYKARDFLEIVGNELYINKEEELKSIFPAKSYLHSEDYGSKIIGLNGFFTTFKNTLNFSKINYSDYLFHFKEIQKKINFDVSNIVDIKDWLDLFLEDYKTVFEINLLSGIVLSRLKQISDIQKDISLTALLGIGEDYLENVMNSISLDFLQKDLFGNSLDVADESMFQKDIQINTKTKSSTAEWIDNLDKKKKEKILTLAKNFVAFSSLREYGRWLIVLRINKFRNILLAMASKEGFSEYCDIYFATVDELVYQEIKESECKKRKGEYQKYLNFNLPNTLADTVISLGSDTTVGVSGGVADGQLVAVDDINKVGKKILYTRALSPDLVQYFGKVEGIISESGGLLSHLSIMAREKNIPVVVNFNLNKLDIRLNDSIRINGENGKVEKIS